MAKLLGTPYPGNWNIGEDWEKDVKRADEQLAAIPEDKLIKFPMADGYAFYFVVSLEPLVLQWIPFLDKWQISAAHIRGLRKRDVLAMIYHEKVIRELFSKGEKKIKINR